MHKHIARTGRARGSGARGFSFGGANILGESRGPSKIAEEELSLRVEGDGGEVAELQS